MRSAGRALGICAGAVRKVIEVGWLARIPLLPREVVGITPYRGRMVTVIDLAVLLGREGVVGIGEERRIVVLDGGGRNLGILVERIEEVVVLSPEARATTGGKGRAITQRASWRTEDVEILDGEVLVEQISELCGLEG